jgi:hypothetical protein
MNFDLNIQNYKKHELIRMFELPDNYDRAIVEIKESKMRENILNDKDISEIIRMKTIQFLSSAKNIILEDQYKAGGAGVGGPGYEFIQNVNEIYNTSYDLKPIKVEQDNDHMVQVRKEKPYLSSYPSEFFPGIINPLKKKVNRINLNIDTRFRENYYGTASTFFNMICPLHINNVMTMQLTAIELPLSFMNVCKQFDNNFFKITVNNISTTIFIPNGNYTPDAIMKVINNLLVNLGGYFQYIVFLVNENNGGNNKTIVGINSTYTGSEPIDFSIDFQANGAGTFDDSTPLPLKFGWLLGFRNGVYINNQSYVSEGIIDMQPTKYVYLCVDDYNNNVSNSFYSAFNSSVLNKNILARITLLTNVSFATYSENNFNVVTFPRQYFGPVNVHSLQIQLLDAYGRVVDLDNMDFSFCLTFQTAYDI